jgi:hypothetical protein
MQSFSQAGLLKGRVGIRKVGGGLRFGHHRQIRDPVELERDDVTLLARLDVENRSFLEQAGALDLSLYVASACPKPCWPGAKENPSKCRLKAVGAFEDLVLKGGE